MALEFRPIRFDAPTDQALKDITELYLEEWTGFSPETLYAKYAGNPQAPGTFPYFLGVYIDGKLAGANGYIATNFTSGGERYLGVQDCDSYVGKAYRGQGIFGKLIRECERLFAELGADFLFGYPNENSFGSYQRLGWTIGRHIDYQGKAYVGPLGAMMLARDKAALRTAERQGYELRELDPAALGSEGADLRGLGDHLAGQYVDGSYLAWRLRAERARYKAVLVRKDTQSSWVAWRQDEGSIKIMALGGQSAGMALALRSACISLGGRGRAQACSPLSEPAALAFRAAGFMGPTLMRMIKKRTMRVVYKALGTRTPDVGNLLDVQYADFDTV
jgi:GNAT superfamily N-acetyltransferase